MNKEFLSSMYPKGAINNFQPSIQVDSQAQVDVKEILARLISNKSCKVACPVDFTVTERIEMAGRLHNYLNVLKSKEKTLVEGFDIAFDNFVIRYTVHHVCNSAGNIPHIHFTAEPPVEKQKFTILE